MVPNEKVKTIKKLQKEATIMRNLALVFHKCFPNQSLFHKVSLNRLDVSENGSVIIIYFYSSFGREVVEEVIKQLVPKIAHIRYELAQLLQCRYMPKLVLKYDLHEEKVININKKIEDALEKDRKQEN